MQKIFFSFFYLIATLTLTNNLFTQSETPSNEFSIAQKNEITFGQSAALSGPLAVYGSIIQAAITTKFKAINNEGGINGKTIRLISLDDEGDPIKAKENMLRLQKNGVSMFLGNTHTRSILNMLPQIKNKEIAVFFPWGGDTQLRDSKLSHIINGPGFLEPQLNFLVEHITSNIQHRKIAIFHADDYFSTEATEHLIKMLTQSGITPIATCSFNRHTLDIVKQADKIMEAAPKVVICISTSMPATRLINRFFQQGNYATLFFGIDSTLFVGDILKNRGVYFSYTSPVPDPFSNSIPIAQEYREALRQYAPDQSANILSFSYYLAASIIVDAIKKIQEPISKEKIIEQIEAMTYYNLGGFIVQFDPTIRHAFGKTVSLIKG